MLDFPLEILYEDNHLLAAVKPAGVLSQADSSGDPDMLTLLKNYLKEKYQKPGNVWLGLVHRLDQPVAGVMVFAKTSKAASRLSLQMRERTFGKYYWAVATGDNMPASALLEDNIEKSSPAGKKKYKKGPSKRGSSACQVSQKAILSMEKLQTIKYQDVNLNLVAIKLQTGRNHQIRIQLASRDWVILGDAKYASKKNLQEWQKWPLPCVLDEQVRKHYDLALFCCSLEFLHPISKEKVRIKATLPKQFPWSLFANGLHDT